MLRSQGPDHTGTPSISEHSLSFKTSPILIVNLLIIAILTTLRWYLIAALICMSLMINDHHMSLGHLCILLREMSIHVLCLFFNHIVWFLFTILERGAISGASTWLCSLP